MVEKPNLKSLKKISIIGEKINDKEVDGIIQQIKKLLLYE